MTRTRAILFTCLLAVLVGGCEEQRRTNVGGTHTLFYRPKDGPPVKVIYCNDYTGHLPGTKPFIFGGTCCCTPTLELMDAYHRDGFLLNYSAAQLLDVYESMGIQTIYDHHDCNNCCKWGPHILQGGKCMVPPTPGTRHFEEIITGRFQVPAKEPEEQDRRK